jgi:hypothetical protein
MRVEAIGMTSQDVQAPLAWTMTAGVPSPAAAGPAHQRTSAAVKILIRALMAIPFAVVRQRRDTCAAGVNGRVLGLRGEYGSSTIYQKIGRGRGDRAGDPIFRGIPAHLRGRSSSVCRPFRPVYRVERQHGVLRPPSDPPPRGEPFLFQLGADGLLQSFLGTALKLSAATKLFRQELEAVSTQAICGPDHLPWSVGLSQFALEAAALIGEAFKALAGPLVGAMAQVEIAVSIDQAAQIIDR